MPVLNIYIYRKHFKIKSMHSKIININRYVKEISLQKYISNIL